MSDVNGFLMSIAVVAWAVFTGWLLALNSRDLKRNQGVDHHVYGNEDFKHGEDKE